MTRTTTVCWRPLTMVVLTLLAVNAGCTRAYYRRQADADAYSLIQQKTCDPAWPLQGYTINVDPSSRMFDPNSIDRPPMPPDDPAAHRYMHCVDHKRGWPFWHACGDTPYVENPDWESFLPRCPSGNILIDEATAIGLALLHSPTYQRELEDLYLSALDVSFERFRFDAQFFGAEALTYTADGKDRSGTGRSSSQLELSSRTGSLFPNSPNWFMRKRFSAGGELVVGVANSILWQFAGPDSNATTTLFDFTFIQPLLRLGGRDFILERLTLAERVLLGNVRLMERFRQQFYLQVMTGQFAFGGPSRRGGVFGGSGLEGFSGVGGGGFGQLNIGLGGFQTGNSGIAGGAGAGLAGGFLGLLQLQQGIRNQQANVAALESSVSQLEAFFRAGRIDYFQVELARQALYNAQSLLLNNRLAYENQKDSFKQTMGIPPRVIIEIDDTIIKPFQLIDADAIRLQNELSQIQRQLGDAVIAILSMSQQTSTSRTPSEESESDAGGRPPAAESDTTDLDEALRGLDAYSSHSKSPAQPATQGIFAASYAQPVDASGTIATTIQNLDAPKNETAAPPTDRSEDSAERAVNPGPEIQRQLDAVRQVLERAGKMCDTIVSQQIPTAETAIEELTDSLRQRRTRMARLRRLIEAQIKEEAETCGDDPPPDVDVDAIIPFDPARLKNLPEQLKAAVADIEKRVQQISGQLEDFEKLTAQLSESSETSDPVALFQRINSELLAPAPNALNELSANLLSVILVQVRARTQTADIVPVEIDWREATEIAREHRLDWMNARANLVDSWRLIQFNSDALQSGLDFIFNGDISNQGDNPLDLRGSKGRLRVGVAFDAPLTRLSERNTYRQSLIEYQQARRSFYQFQDQVTTDLRTTIRGLRVNQVNFELRRAAVEVAVAQVELTRLRLQQPPQVGQDTVLGATTARDLVTALSDLLNVQNDFLSVWINHEALRRSLDVSLGTMQVGTNGFWIDPGPIIRLADNASDSDAAGSQSAPDGVPGEAPPIEQLPAPALQKIRSADSGNAAEGGGRDDASSVQLASAVAPLRTASGVERLPASSVNFADRIEASVSATVLPSREVPLPGVSDSSLTLFKSLAAPQGAP